VTAQLSFVHISDNLNSERARSISPTKSSPANTPTTARTSVVQASSLSLSDSPRIEPQGDSEPARDMGIDGAMEKLTGSSTSPTKENTFLLDAERSTGSESNQESSIKASPSNAMPSRTPTLSWQQRRPQSQNSDRPRSRPLSMVAAENAARSPRATPTPEPTSSSGQEPTMSRDQITQSLASKDPAWFRQTADRGLNSPAYRKNQVEDDERSDHGSNSARRQLPGMSRVGSDTEKFMGELADRSSSPSRSSTTTYGSGSRFSEQASPRVSSGMGSPMSLTPAQRLDPPDESLSEGRAIAMSPTQGRISPERLDRPASPTKGMGGFVQSAMMKRSDSVNKRWSVQSPPGLSRGNSVASNRSSIDPATGTGLGSITNATAQMPRPLSSLSRENSPHPNSRPTSSHSNATVTQERPGTSSSMKSSMTTSTTDSFAKPALPTPRTQTPLGVKPDQDSVPVEQLARVQTPPPSSPSKTLESKRWSPTKSSWLESALNKPESPKPKVAAPPPQQPAWMAEISKAKQKSSVDLSRNPPPVGSKHEVSIGGLMRSPPMGGPAKPPSIGGLPAGFSSGLISKNRSESNSSPESKALSNRDSEQLASSTSSPVASKPSPANGKVKPETPPKKDFRANLKPRQPPPDNSGSSEPEFKNVFGQLRRTKTQNYVAPDVLKSNITQGKAALNITGGPKKTERKDEFKDAILEKKKAFEIAQREGKGVTRSTSGGSQDAALPEALAKRRELGRSGSIIESTPSTSETSSRQRPVPNSPKPIMPTKEMSAPGRLEAKEPTVTKLAGRLNPGLAGILARGPPSVASETSRSSSPASSQRTVSMSTSTTAPEAPGSGPQLTHMTKGRARGPRRKAPSSAPAATTPDPVTDTKDTKSVSGEDSRSRSPFKDQTSLKVAVPAKDSPIMDVENPVSQPSSPRKLDMKRRSQFLQEVPNMNTKTEAQVQSPKQMSPKKTFNASNDKIDINQPDSSIPSRSPAFALPQSELEQKAPPPKPKPSTPSKSPSLTSKKSEKSSAPHPAESPETAKVRPPPLSPSKLAPSDPPSRALASDARVTPALTGNKEQPNVSSKEAVNRISTVSVKNASALWDRPLLAQAAENPPRARSPIKLPTHSDEKAAMIGAGLRSASPTKDKGPVGLGIQSAREPQAARPLPTPPMKCPLSPPPSAGLMPSLVASKSNESPVPQTSEASKMLTEFFLERRPVEFKIDTAALLSERPEQSTNIKTLRSSLYQLSSDGKKQLVPNHQERILFEGNLYLCSHTFGNAAGKKVTEAYYWIGDDVPTEVAKEVEIFAQREAKSAGGKLVTIRQGKETPEFFHALGGIIIVRRGSSNKYDSLAPHILCGRKHFGQIAFDEVDFSPTSLCSGFPYLISTQSGKSYLWKGRGSGIDELSCARLIGMDFGLTGEVEEVEDGNEPQSFLQTFGNGATKPKSADHWKLKPNYNKYLGRLFHVDSTTKEQVCYHTYLIALLYRS
jgi:hypothetical protein